jgi:histidine triad (HIT) family protein
MDVMPHVDGHCLVIPKEGSRNLLDAKPSTFAPLMATVQKVARAAKTAFNADGVQIRQYNEPAAGQTVFHLHFHILPLNEGQSLRPHSGKMAIMVYWRSMQR